MIYREDGWVAEVEVLSKEQENGGCKTILKVIKTIRESPYIKLEALPKDGEIFSVWKADGAGFYGGWTLDAY